jgi:hypothetical protein
VLLYLAECFIAIQVLAAREEPEFGGRLIDHDTKL